MGSGISNGNGDDNGTGITTLLCTVHRYRFCCYVVNVVAFAMYKRASVVPRYTIALTNETMLHFAMVTSKRLVHSLSRYISVFLTTMLQLIVQLN